MSIRHLRVFILVLLAAPLQGAWAGPAETSTSTIHFKVLRDSLIVVPVKVNGAGPFDFMLDTGTSQTIVDSVLAAQLRLPVTGHTATTFLTSTSSVVGTAHADTLAVEGETVRDLEMSILPPEVFRGMDVKVRGIVGEDFLKNDDLLLDNRHHLLRMDRGSGPMAEMLYGEHVSLSVHGSMRGVSTHNRLMLSLMIPDVAHAPVKLQLDSAACLIILFHRQSPLLAQDMFNPVRVGDAGGGRTSMHRSQVRVLTVGGHLLKNVTLMTPLVSEEKDSDGLLPTNLFDSVYISRSGGFAIFNPVIQSAKGPH